MRSQENILQTLDATNSHIMKVQETIRDMAIQVEKHFNVESYPTHEAIHDIQCNNIETKTIIEDIYVRLMDNCDGRLQQLCSMGCHKTMTNIGKQQEELQVQIVKLQEQISSLKTAFNRFAGLLTRMEHALGKDKL